jgi:hypothetical protein
MRPITSKADEDNAFTRLRTESGYVASERSLAFPGLSFDEIDRHIAMAKTGGNELR